MAKRVRSRSSRRPGGQGPSRTRKTTGASTTPAEGVASATTDADIEPELETVEADYSEVVTEAPIETAAEPAAAPRESKRSRRARRRTKAKPDDLAARAAAENVWVRQDLRRIGIVTVILLVALAVAWVVFVALDVLSLY